jgi:tetratricopeptide (TPR) repeat protein
MEDLVKSGEILISAKDYKTATYFFAKALELKADDEKIKSLIKYSDNMRLGLEALKNEEVSSAISLFSIALDSRPNDTEARKLKDKALARKDELDNPVVPVGANTAEFEEAEEETFVQEDEETFIQESVEYEEPDYAKEEFINTMNNLMGNFNQNVLTPLANSSPSLTNFSRLEANLENIYWESVSLNTPYAEYQPIMDNWLSCLEATSDLLQMFRDLKGGDYTVFNTDLIAPVYDYYENTENGLISIQNIN